MSSFLIRNAQRNQLRDLQLAINGLLQRKASLTFGNSEEALDDLIKIEAGLKLVQQSINGARKDTRVSGFSSKQRRGRNAEFESELGRVGQMRGELSLLQNQLSQLEKSLPAIRHMIQGRLNSPVQQSSNVLDHLSEVQKKHDSYKHLIKSVSQPPKDSILEMPSPQLAGVADLPLAMATLAAFIYAFLKKSR